MGRHLAICALLVVALASVGCRKEEPPDPGPVGPAIADPASTEPSPLPEVGDELEMPEPPPMGEAGAGKQAVVVMEVDSSVFTRLGAPVYPRSIGFRPADGDPEAMVGLVTTDAPEDVVSFYLERRPGCVDVRAFLTQLTDKSARAAETLAASGALGGVADGEAWLERARKDIASGLERLSAFGSVEVLVDHGRGFSVLVIPSEAGDTVFLVPVPVSQLVPADTMAEWKADEATLDGVLEAQGNEGDPGQAPSTP